MTDAPRPFGEWLDATMRSRGLSQAQFARQVGVADAQVSRWRRGSVTPSVRHLHQIAATFDVPRATLERMAGYPTDEGPAGGPAHDLDPEREAQLGALQARFRQAVEGKVPEALWEAYAEACEALADELANSFEHALATARGRTARSIGFRRKDQEPGNTPREENRP